MYIHVSVHVYINLYTHRSTSTIYRERERERDGKRDGERQSIPEYAARHMVHMCQHVLADVTNPINPKPLICDCTFFD